MSNTRTTLGVVKGVFLYLFKQIQPSSKKRHVKYRADNSVSRRGFSSSIWQIARRMPSFLFLAVLVLAVAIYSVLPTKAAISFRSASSGNNAGGATTLSITKPTTVLQGDVMVAIISVRVGTGTTISTVPTGWTLINSRDNTTNLIKSSTYYKVASASETGPYVWGWATSLKAAGVISVYSGVDRASPIMAQNSQANTSSTTLTAPAITTTEAGTMVIAAYSTATGTTLAAGSSMTLPASGQDRSSGNGAASQNTAGLQYAIQPTAGSTGTKTMTAAAAAENIGHTIALRPAPTVMQSGYRWFENGNAVEDGSTFAKAWGGTRDDRASSIALDSAGSIYVAGFTDSPGLTAGSTDQTLVKYNSSGALQWSKTWGSTGSDSASAVTLESSGNIYVAGYTDSPGLGFVDAAGSLLPDEPNFAFSPILHQSDGQFSYGTFGSSSKRLRVFNSLSTSGWSVSLAATDGPTALRNRSDNLAKYDFNDSVTDGDSLEGNLSIYPVSATIQGVGSCSTTGVSSSTANSDFMQGAVDTITLFSGSSTTAVDCSWDFYGANLQQTVPGNQPAGAYSLSMMATVVAL